MDWNFIKTEIDENDFLLDLRAEESFKKGTIKGACYIPYLKKTFGSDKLTHKKLTFCLNQILELVKSKKKSNIVVFDEGMGMYSARAVYLLRAFQFSKTFLLGAQWPLSYPIETNQQIIESEGQSEKVLELKGVVNKEYLEKNLTKLQIFDARTKEEYDGKIPRLTKPEDGSLCGRLPGAFLLNWSELYNTDGFLIGKDQLKKRLKGFPFMPERTTVIYDYNGARSSLLALMLKEIGFVDIHVYLGSWFEWRKTKNPKQAVSIYGNQTKAVVAPRVGGVDRKIAEKDIE